MRKIGVKFMSIVAAASLLLALASCSSGSGPSSNASSTAAKNVTLTFMTTVPTTTDDSIKPLVDKYHADGVTIDYQPVPGSTSDYQTKLTTLFAANTYPDIIYVPTIWSKMHAAQGVTEELDGEISQSIVDDYNPAPLETCKYNGKLIGLPIAADCITLFYNKQMVAKAGITNVPTTYDTSWSWDDFVGNAGTIQKANSTPYGVVFAPDFSIELPFFWQAGATVLNSDQTGVAVNQQGAVDALNLLRKMVDLNLTTTNIFLGVDDARSMFCQQRSPFYMANSGETATILKTVNGAFDLGVTYLPHHKISANKIGGFNIEVTNKTKNLPEALNFMEYMVSNDVMNAYCLSTGAMPTRKSAASSIQFGALAPYAPVFIDQIAQIPSTVISDSVNKQYQTYKGIMMKEFQNFIANPSQSADTAAANMEKSIKQALSF